jgi:hypothetical protein
MRLLPVNHILLGTVVVLMGAAAPAAGAAVFNVSTAAQLEAAVDTANGNGQNDTINLAAGLYPLSSSLVVGKFGVTLAGETLTLRGPAAGRRSSTGRRCSAPTSSTPCGRRTSTT